MATLPHSALQGITFKLGDTGVHGYSILFPHVREEKRERERLGGKTCSHFYELQVSE